MDCETARKLIQVFLDGELSDPQPLEEHLAGCTACSQELAVQKALAETMGAWQGIESRRTYAEFRERVESTRHRRWRLPTWSPSPRWAIAALVAVAFLGGGVSGWHHGASVAPHKHVMTAEMEQVSESLELDAFSGGLSDVVIANAGEVAQ